MVQVNLKLSLYMDNAGASSTFTLAAVAECGAPHTPLSLGGSRRPRRRTARRLNSLLTSGRLRPPQTKGVPPVTDTGEIALNTDYVIFMYQFRCSILL